MQKLKVWDHASLCRWELRQPPNPAGFRNWLFTEKLLDVTAIEFGSQFSVRALGLAAVRAALWPLPWGCGVPTSPQQHPPEPWGARGPTSSAHPWPESLRLVPD